jgi:BolA protein
MNMLARHRAVYAALDDMMKTDIHALAIDAIASDEL